MGDPLHHPGHAGDVEDEARQDEGWQEGDDDGDLSGDELVLATVEISRPMPSDASMNNAETPKRTRKEPRNGTSNTKIAIAVESVMPPMPRTK